LAGDQLARLLFRQYFMGLLTRWAYLPQNSLFTFWEGFPSGQRDQTVNLTAQPSEVRILPPPPPGKLETRDLEPHIDFGVYWERKDHGPMRHTAPDTLVFVCQFVAGGCSSMVEPQPSKLMMWVRFPSPAPARRTENRTLRTDNRLSSAFSLLICPYSSVGRALPW
jgi:hypothetical protein